MASVPFLNPLKTTETRVFLTFSGGIEMEHGLKWVKIIGKSLEAAAANCSDIFRTFSKIYDSFSVIIMGFKN